MKILPKTHPETGPKTGSPSKPYFSWFLTIFNKSGGPNWDHISRKTRPKIRSILGPGLERDWKAMEREKWLGGLSARGWAGFTPPLGGDFPMASDPRGVGSAAGPFSTSNRFFIDFFPGPFLETLFFASFAALWTKINRFRLGPILAPKLGPSTVPLRAPIQDPLKR